MSESRNSPVLVGVDGSPAGEAAARWAAREAAYRAVPLELLHVFTPSVGDGPTREAGMNCLIRAEAIARQTVPGQPSARVLQPGDAVEKLIERSGSVAVIAVGAWGFGRGANPFLGGVARAVVARSKAPVVVVRGQPPDTGPVVVGVDDSPDGAAALRFAYAAAAVRGCPLIAVRVWYDLEEEAAGARMLAESVEYLRRARSGVLVQPRLVRERHRADGILSASAGPRLIVVGSRRRRMRGRSILGITTHAILDRARCPVAVVPALSRPR
ncbi:universal stress protein [Amycolatopsis coloradensis]|uniref:Universal stress protein n=1 Tax=Amycolatopsis coloradensis TaxID=76021 RepID=A0ACD5BFL1_9PSEU